MISTETITASEAGSQARARQAAQAALEAAGQAVEPTPAAAFQSAGRTLLVAPQAGPAVAAAQQLADRLTCTVVAPDAVDQRRGPVRQVPGELAGLTGFLGAFDARLATAAGSVSLAAEVDEPGNDFDLVIDFCTPSWIPAETPPYGYYPVGDDAAALERALAEAPAMVGQFEKPKFFVLDPQICSHGTRGLNACTRCLDACPTGAITSLGTEISVDPGLCQGVGVCVTTCPAGAISYAYPRPADLLDAVRDALAAHRANGGIAPTLLFHDLDAGAERLEALLPALPERVVPVGVAEVGSVGMEVWTAALAYGAGRVALLPGDEMAPTAAATMAREVDYAQRILGALGAGGRVCWLAGDDDEVCTALADPPDGLAPPASFRVRNDKRATLRLALQHLQATLGTPREPLPLPNGAPFGQIRVDSEACTLCLSCAAVCPNQALADGGDEAPQLRFREEACVQCGLCQQACPESAITLEPRFLFDWAQRQSERVLHEEEPAYCPGCGVAFGTRSSVERMIGRLADHPMFQNAADLERLRMCGDCRVKDQFRAELDDSGPRKAPRVYGPAPEDGQWRRRAGRERRKG